MSIINGVIGFIVLAVILASVSTNLVNGIFFAGQYTRKMHQESQYKLMHVKNEIEKEMKLIEGTVNSIAMSADNRIKSNPYLDMNEEEAYYNALFSQYLLSNQAVSDSIYIYFDPEIDGDVHDVWVTRQSEDQAYREAEIPLVRYQENDNMSWFYGPKESQTSNWIDPYKNRYGEYITSYVVPIFSEQEFMGITGMYFDISKVHNIFAKQVDAGDSLFWLINNADGVIHHPMLSEGSMVDNYIVEQGYSSVLDEKIITIHDKDYYLYQVNLDSGWELSYALDKSFLDENVRQALARVLITLAISLLIILFPVFYFGRKYTNIFDHILYVLTEVKKGNLNKRISIQTKNQIGLMSQAINDSNENLVRLIQEKNQLAYYNGITDLPNRISLSNDLERLLMDENRTNLCLLYVDIDNFRSINELIGYSQGNVLVRKVAGILESYEESMVQLYHTSVDEFVFLMRKPMEEDEIGHFARRILSKFGRNYTLGFHSFYLTLSLGVAEYNKTIKTISDFYRIADIAIFEAKKLGRNNFVIYNQTMYDRLIQYNTYEKDFEKALRNKEFVVYYQPQVQCLSGRVESVEALVRWQHPEKGLLFPNYFINYAEKSGLISDLGDQVLEMACRQLKEWHEQGLMMSVAINISKRQIMDNDFVIRTMDLIRELDVNPKYLEFEITETMITVDSESTLHKLSQLNDYGIRISLDDFGTGYSSFNSLNELPLSILKIDKGLVDDILSSPESLIMTEAIIDLAHKLRLEVIAEGIEEKDQLDVLKSLRCDMIQGYLYSKPVTSGELTEFVRQMETEGLDLE